MDKEVTLAELARCLDRIERKLDKVADDHEQRIRRTERYLYVALGLAGASGLGSVASWIGG